MISNSRLQITLLSFLFKKLNIIKKGINIKDTLKLSTSYPGSFHYAPRWRKDPGPGWSRVSQILGDNKRFAQGWGAKLVLPF